MLWYDLRCTVKHVLAQYSCYIPPSSYTMCNIVVSTCLNVLFNNFKNFTKNRKLKRWRFMLKKSEINLSHKKNNIFDLVILDHSFTSLHFFNLVSCNLIRVVNNFSDFKLLSPITFSRPKKKIERIRTVRGDIVHHLHSLEYCYKVIEDSYGTSPIPQPALSVLARGYWV